jgi:hypothetical protein
MDNAEVDALDVVDDVVDDEVVDETVDIVFLLNR